MTKALGRRGVRILLTAMALLAAAGVALATTPDNTWKDPVSGDWAAGDRDSNGNIVSPFWSTGRLPTSTEWVAIDKPGNYFVRLSYLGANSSNLAPVVRGLDVTGAGATLGIVRRSLTATEGLNIGPGANLVLARVNTPFGDYGIDGGPLVNDGSVVARDDMSSIRSASVRNNGMLQVLGGGTYNDGLAYPQSSAALTIANDTDNYGSIVLTSATSANATLNLPAAKTIRNKAGAEIRIEAGAGGLREVRANLENDGTVSGQGVVAQYGGTFTNRGMVDFTAPGAGIGPWSVNPERFKQEAGTLKFNQFWWPNSHFEYHGGSIQGVVEMLGHASFIDPNVPQPSTLTFGTDPLAPAEFIVNGLRPGTKVFGDVPESVKIRLEGGGVVAGVDSAAADIRGAYLFGDPTLTNRGTIEMIAHRVFPGGDVRLRSQIGTSGIVRNAATGLIETLPGAGGTRSFEGGLLNEGWIRARTATNLMTQASTVEHRNFGMISIEGAATNFEVQWPKGFFNESGGLLEGIGTMRWVFGPGQVAPGQFFVNKGTIDPGLRAVVRNGQPVRAAAPTGTLTVGGSYSEDFATPTGEVVIDIGGTAAGDFDKLAVGTATLAGTLKVGHVGPFVPSHGNAFRILTTANPIGRVGTWSNTLPLDANGDGTVVSEDGVRYTVDYGPNYVDLKDPNVAPVAVDDAHSTPEDTALSVAAPGVLGNDTDADGDALAVTAASPIDDVDHGSLTLNADGSFTYTPDADFCGPDSFTYNATDGRADSNAATVAITVNCVNDPPVAYAGDDQTVDEGALVALDGSGSFDPEGTALTYAWEQMGGTAVTLSDPTAPQPSFTAPSVGPSGEILTFRLTVDDGAAAATDTVDVVVRNVNQPPVAVDDDYSTPKGTALVVAAPGVLGNDTDADGDALAVTAASPIDDVDHGSLTLNADGSFSYIPAADYCGPDAFSYKATDGRADSNAASVAITVDCVNDVVLFVRGGDIYAVSANPGVPVQLTSGNAIDTEPDWFPGNERIAFSRNGDIYVMDDDGANVMQLTSGSQIDTSPAVSPGGTQIAFARRGPGGNWDVYVMAADDGGSLQRRTDHPAFDGLPAWATDGSALAFFSGRSGNGDIWKLNITGGALTRLTTSAGIDTEPAWFGSTIAFSSNRVSSSNFELYTMDDDGTDQVRRTIQAGHDVTPSWSGDGERLAFATNRTPSGGGFNFNIFTMNKDGRGQTPLVTHGAADLFPDW